MMRVTFWASAGLIVYTYVLFPLIVIVRGVVARRPFIAAPIEPQVAIIIAARNERASIAGKVTNLLNLDYPADRFEVVIASDGSTDGTIDAVRDLVSGLPHPGSVQILELPPSGKAVALTAAVRASRGEVLVFSDANSMYARTALRALVRPFADPAVGGVAGNQVYRSAGELGEDAGERGYWNYDRTLKEFESRAGNTIAGTGAIYAIRRSLFRPIPPGVNDDFFETAGVIDQGFRLVFAGNAVAWEPPAARIDAEYHRKVRVVSRAMRCVLAMPRLLDVRLHGFYSLQLLSHKVLRWAMGMPLITLLVASASLARDGRFYATAFAAQATCYALAAAGTIAGGSRFASSPAVAVPAYFVMVNRAALRAAWNLVTDHRIDRWEPSRHDANAKLSSTPGDRPMSGPGVR